MTNTCLDTMGRKSGENLSMTYCHNLGGYQVFVYTKSEQIVSDDNCLDASSEQGPVKLVRCHAMGGNQTWVYDEVVREMFKFWYTILCRWDLENEKKILEWSKKLWNAANIISLKVFISCVATALKICREYFDVWKISKN